MRRIIMLALLFLTTSLFTLHPLLSSQAAPTKFSSAYTDIDKGCQNAYKETGEGQDIPAKCKGYGGYYLYKDYSLYATHLSIKMNGDENYAVELNREALTNPASKKLEWRMADGKPFAVIMRISTYREGGMASGEGPFADKYKTGENLLVKGLKGYEQIDFKVDAKTPNANVKAREMADKADTKR
jgi:hypothetical protein